MFKMMVDSAIKLHDNLITLAGPCEDKSSFANRLIDSDGNEYEAHVPLFDKTLIYDDSKIIVGIFGQYDVEDFKGQIFTS